MSFDVQLRIANGSFQSLRFLFASPVSFKLLLLPVV